VAVRDYDICVRSDNARGPKGSEEGKGQRDLFGRMKMGTIQKERVPKEKRKKRKGDRKEGKVEKLTGWLKMIHPKKAADERRVKGKQPEKVGRKDWSASIPARLDPKGRQGSEKMPAGGCLGGQPQLRGGGVSK